MRDAGGGVKPQIFGVPQSIRFSVGITRNSRNSRSRQNCRLRHTPGACRHPQTHRRAGQRGRCSRVGGPVWLGQGAPPRAIIIPSCGCSWLWGGVDIFLDLDPVFCRSRVISTFSRLTLTVKANYGCTGPRCWGRRARGYPTNTNPGRGASRCSSCHRHGSTYAGTASCHWYGTPMYKYRATRALCPLCKQLVALATPS